MKNAYFVPIFALIFFILPTTTQAALSDSIVSYWKLDESSGNSSDSVGGNTLTNNSSGTYSTAKINNGYTSADSGPYLSSGTAPVTGTGAFTVSFWMKTTAQNAGRIVAFGANATNEAVIIRMSGNASNKINVDFHGGGGAVQSSTAVNGGTQTFVVVTFGGTGTPFKIYVNGSLEATGSSYSNNNLGNGNMRIGNDVLSSVGFDGQTDEVGVWSRELNSTEVGQLYNSGAGLQYPFSGGGGTTTPTIMGSGTINRLAKFTTSTTTIGDALFSDDGSNTTLTAGNLTLTVGNLFMPIASFIDTFSNGALSFGTSNATTLTFGRVGQTMTINSKLAPNGGIDASGKLDIGTTTASTILIGSATATTTIPKLEVTSQRTTTRCQSSASPAVCSAAPAGSVAMPTGGNTLTVNTTAVTANSQILVTEDFSLGSLLNVTCNTGDNRSFKVSARTLGTTTSFTIRSSANVSSNPACLSFWIIN